MEKLNLTGFLGRDPRVVETQNGNKFVSFSVGVNVFRKGSESTHWYDVLWSDYSDKMLNYLKKGSSVCIGGDFEDSIETNKDGEPILRRQLFADYVQFNSTSGKTSNSTEKNVDSSNNEEISMGVKKETPKVVVKTVEEDDEIPF